MGRPFLSISIATYNKREYVYKNVVEILSSFPGEEIEVVVTDNASTDDTIECLKEISDSRLRIIEKRENTGAACNFIDAIFNAQGEYVLYTNDRDNIIGEGLYPLIKMLRENDYAYVITCRGDKLRTNRVVKYKGGPEALLHVPIAAHPSGKVYNVDLLRKYCNREHYYSYKDLNYPDCFLACDLAKIGDIAFFDCAVFNSGGMVVKQSSFNSGSDEKKFFLHPMKTIELAQTAYEYSHKDISLSWYHKLLLAKKTMTFGMERLIEYKRLRSCNDVAIYHGLPTRVVSKDEIMDWWSRYVEELCPCIKRKQKFIWFVIKIYMYKWARELEKRLKE